MRVIWAAVLTAAAATALVVPRAAHAQQDPPAQPVSPAQPARESNGGATAISTTRPADSGDAPTGTGVTVPDLQATLTHSSSSLASRHEAARRLIARQSDDAREALRLVATTQGGNLDARVAALRALADDLNPSPRLLDGLLGLVNNDNDRIVDEACKAVTAYKREPRIVPTLTAVVDDANRRLAHRLSAARALGLIPTQPAAATLVRLVSAPNANPDIAVVAADALVDMTGLEANGRDAGKWDQWLKEQGGRSPEEWAAELLPTRAARDDRMHRRADEAAAGQARLLQELYDVVPDKPRTLLRFLNDTSPDTRRAGARIADRVSRLPPPADAQITDAVRTRLVDLVGDSDPGVRFDTVNALENINVDADALLTALLPQLRVETDGRVKAAIARTLARVPRNTVVSDLARLLDDPSPAVVREAADAIKRRAPSVLLQDPALAAQTAERLRATMQRLANQPAFLEARRACGEALADLKDPRNLQFSRELLGNRREDPTIRGVAYVILGALGPEAAADITTAVDNERLARVKAEGIRALGRTKSFDRSDWLSQKMNDPEPEVRKAAEETYRLLLSEATPQKLTSEAQRLRQNPELRIDVLKVLIPKLQAAKQDDDAAAFQQTLGVDYLRNVKPPKPELAIPHLRAAMEHMRKNSSPDVLGGLFNQLVSAMIQSRQYAQLASLGNDLSKPNPDDGAAYRQKIGVEMRNEAERLVNDYQRRTGAWQDNLDLASSLITAGMGMSPPLENTYRRDLESTRLTIERLRASQPTNR